MADIAFNISKGRVNELARLAIAGTGGAKLRLLLLKAADTDDAHRDTDTVTALLATAATEADFTSYARKDITSGAARTVDDSANEQWLDFADQTWDPAGGASNNSLTDAVVYYDPDGTDTDSANIPLTQHDFAVTTDGSALILQVGETGFFAAQ